MEKKELIIDKLFLVDILDGYTLYKKDNVDLSTFESRFIKIGKKIEKKYFNFISKFKENKNIKGTGNIQCFLINKYKNPGLFYSEKNKNYYIDKIFNLETYDLIENNELTKFFYFFKELKNIGENKELEIKEIYEAIKYKGTNNDNLLMLEGYVIVLKSPIIINLENKGK
jgi:hypothetical protein